MPLLAGAVGVIVEAIMAKLGWFTLVAVALASMPGAADVSSTPSALGRWDLRVLDPRGDYPSWLEISEQDGQLQGRFVGRVGGARSVTDIVIEDDQVTFELAPQFEPRQDPMRFTGRLDRDRMRGETTDEAGTTISWVAVRAPKLQRRAPVRWGKAIRLVDDGLDAWRPRGNGSLDCWSVDEGELSNGAGCADLVTKKTFRDFKLQLEFRVPEGSDSGVHLRGRYEIQLCDDRMRVPEEASGTTGSLYGFVAPRGTTARAAEEWQSLEATLLGRELTVVLNGETVLDHVEVPGITGDALDSDESLPGPIMLQGYLGPIAFRNVVITPAIDASREL